MRRSLLMLAAFVAALLLASSATAQQIQFKPPDEAKSQLERALNVMYTACLFGEQNAFSEAVALTQRFLAPGIAGFMESNLAALPLAPPNLDAVYADGQLTTVVTGFTPVFTESSATVGQGLILAGGSFSYHDLSRIRGQALDDLSFVFEQNGGGDQIVVTMPLDIDASVITLYGTYGVTNRLDVGVALPIVRLTMRQDATRFQVVGSQTGLRYGGVSDVVDYKFTEDVAIDVAADGQVELTPDFPAVSETQTYLNTLAVRTKYRLPLETGTGSLATVLDVRLPVGRSEDDALGQGNLGIRLTLVGEYDALGAFKPYVNVGGQYWDGDSNSLRTSLGFSQQLASKVFFAFDLLGEFDLDEDAFLDALDEDALLTRQLVGTTIPGRDREHTLNAGLGLQIAFTPGFHVYGSALFALLDSGLQAPVAPTAGAALHF